MKLFGILWTRLFLFGTFIFIPVWVLIFIVNYIISFKESKKYDYLMPIMTILTQTGLLYYYLMAYPIYSPDQIRINYAFVNIALSVFITFLKIKNKQRLYLIPFVLVLAWIISYIY